MMDIKDLFIIISRRCVRTARRCTCTTLCLVSRAHPSLANRVVSPLPCIRCTRSHYRRTIACTFLKILAICVRPASSGRRSNSRANFSFSAASLGTRWNFRATTSEKRTFSLHRRSHNVVPRGSNVARAYSLRT